MQKKGFTLIELLIVVTIIGILAVALVPRIVGGSASARDARRQTDLQNIAKGLEVYLSENGDFDALGSGGVKACAATAALVNALEPIIGAMPYDPKDGNGCVNNNSYYIEFLEDSAGLLTKYAIAANLEVPEVGDDLVYNSTSFTSTGDDQYDTFVGQLVEFDDSVTGVYVLY